MQRTCRVDLKHADKVGVRWGGLGRNGTLRAICVAQDGPAARAGVAVGDVLISIDSVVAADSTAAAVRAAFQNAAAAGACTLVIVKAADAERATRVESVGSHDGSPTSGGSSACLSPTTDVAGTEPKTPNSVCTEPCGLWSPVSGRRFPPTPVKAGAAAAAAAAPLVARSNATAAPAATPAATHVDPAAADEDALCQRLESPGWTVSVGTRSPCRSPLERSVSPLTAAVAPMIPLPAARKMHTASLLRDLPSVSNNNNNNNNNNNSCEDVEVSAGSSFNTAHSRTTGILRSSSTSFAASMTAVSSASFVNAPPSIPSPPLTFAKRVPSSSPQRVLTAGSTSSVDNESIERWNSELLGNCSFQSVGSLGALGASMRSVGSKRGSGMRRRTQLASLVSASPSGDSFGAASFNSSLDRSERRAKMRQECESYLDARDGVDVEEAEAVTHHSASPTADVDVDVDGSIDMSPTGSPPPPVLRSLTAARTASTSGGSSSMPASICVPLASRSAPIDIPQARPMDPEHDDGAVDVSAAAYPMSAIHTSAHLGSVGGLPRDDIAAGVGMGTVAAAYEYTRADSVSFDVEIPSPPDSPPETSVQVSPACTSLKSCMVSNSSWGRAEPSMKRGSSKRMSWAPGVKSPTTKRSVTVV